MFEHIENHIKTKISKPGTICINNCRKKETISGDQIQITLENMASEKGKTCHS